MTSGWGHHTGHAMGAVVEVFFFWGGGKGRVVNLRLDRPGVDRIPPAPRVGVASGVATDIASHRDVLVTDGVLYAIVLQYIFIYLDRLDCTREYIIRHACMLRPRWMSMNHDSSRQWAGCVGAPRVCVCARVCFRRANARPQSSTVDRRPSTVDRRPSTVGSLARAFVVES